MRLRFIFKQLGLLLLLMSACMLPSALAAAYFHHLRNDPSSWEALRALLTSAGIGVAVASVLLLAGKSDKRALGRREALLLVALAWVIGAALAALPFRVWAAWHEFTPQEDPAFLSTVNCYFEAMSGLTTTGSSVLTNIESIPKSLLLWRSFIQWLGGLGIVVLFVAVLPIIGVGGKRMFRFEAPGPKKEGVRPRIQAAAQMLWIIYVGITLLEVVALWLAGAGMFDSVCHAFTTMATGGFSTHTTSVTGIGGWRFELIIIVFMFLAGVNFSLYDALIIGRWRVMLKNREFQAYIGIIVVSAIVLFFLIDRSSIATMDADNPDSGVWSAMRHALFTVVSLQTTTGFGTADYDQWSFPAKCILVGLMFVGGCAGSTGGGIKVIRFVMLAKVLLAELEAVFRPNVVQRVKIGNATIDPQMRSATLIYFLLFGVIMVVSTLLILMFEGNAMFEYHGGNAAATSFSAVAATLNNIGPGVDLVGPTCNFALFNNATKILLSILMALGRLELYAFLVLLLPAFWRED